MTGEQTKEAGFGEFCGSLILEYVVMSEGPHLGVVSSSLSALSSHRQEMLGTRGPLPSRGELLLEGGQLASGVEEGCAGGGRLCGQRPGLLGAPRTRSASEQAGPSLPATLKAAPFPGAGLRGWRRCEHPAASVLARDLERSGSTDSRFAEQGE